MAWADEVTSAEWGNITGTLSNQTDLQTALNAKENSLGNPSADGYILESDTAGNRNWIPKPTGGGGSAEEDYVYMIACMM
jgi:hypothetical protein